MRYGIKINSSYKMIAYSTIIVILLMIALPVLFLEYDSDSKKVNFFNVEDSNVISNKGKIVFHKDDKVKLYNEKKDKIEEIDLEEYITGVVASEMQANFNEEALKAQAVAARTFYMNKRNEPCSKASKKGAEICNSTHCQVYVDKDERLKKWNSKDAENNWNKIKKAVEDTKGEVLTYKGELLKYPQFFAVSSGNTEDAADVFSFDVPYLKSTESKGDEIAPKYKSQVKLSVDQFVSKFNNSYRGSSLTNKNISSNIEVLNYTKAGSVKEIKIGGIKITGKDFRFLFNLNSANFKINISNNNVIINCIGYGHGVGMSQWGANSMASNGAKYDEILKHYYTDVDIEKIEND